MFRAVALSSYSCVLRRTENVVVRVAFLGPDLLDNSPATEHSGLPCRFRLSEQRRRGVELTGARESHGEDDKRLSNVTRSSHWEPATCQLNYWSLSAAQSSEENAVRL